MTDEQGSGSDDGSDSASASDDEDDDGARSDVDEETKQHRQKQKLYNEEIRDLEKAVESKKREVEVSTNIIVKVSAAQLNRAKLTSVLETIPRLTPQAPSGSRRQAAGSAGKQPRSRQEEARSARCQAKGCRRSSYGGHEGSRRCCRIINSSASRVGCCFSSLTSQDQRSFYTRHAG